MGCKALILRSGKMLKNEAKKYSPSKHLCCKGENDESNADIIFGRIR